MVYTIYTEKKYPHNTEAINLKNSLIEDLEIKSLKEVRIINRYFIENIDYDILGKAKTYRKRFTVPVDFHVILLFNLAKGRQRLRNANCYAAIRSAARLVACRNRIFEQSKM